MIHSFLKKERNFLLKKHSNYPYQKIHPPKAMYNSCVPHPIGHKHLYLSPPKKELLSQKQELFPPTNPKHILLFTHQNITQSKLVTDILISLHYALNKNTLDFLRKKPDATSIICLR